MKNSVACIALVTSIIISSAGITDLAKSNSTKIDEVEPFIESKYQGCLDIKLTNGTGFFEVAQDENGVWWFVTPEGYAFYSLGINVVKTGFSHVYDVNILDKYGSHCEWANATRNRLRTWGFNTLGAWSNYSLFVDDPIPYTHTFIFRLDGRDQWRRTVKKHVPDVFDPFWWEIVQNGIGEVAESLKNDPYLIGYWLDNEIHWEPNIKGFSQDSLLEVYMSVSYERHQPGKYKAVEFLINRYKDDGIRTFNKVWNMNLKSFDELYDVIKLGRVGWKAQHFIPRVKSDIQDFAQLVAHVYFENITRILRSYDPNHLILGVRFHPFGAPEGVIKECGKYCDVISINNYRDCKQIYDPIKRMQILVRDLIPYDNWMKRYYDITDKPLLVSEWNSDPLGILIFFNIRSSVKSKADYYEWYTRNCLKRPYIIGHHWFAFIDKMKGDTVVSIGVVDSYDEEHTVLVERMADINKQVYELH
jgi:agarase